MQNDFVNDLAYVDEEIKKTYAIFESAKKELDQLNELRDSILYDMYKHNMDDMEWLIKNPCMPGSHEAMENKIKKLYGGLYNGVHPYGYVADDNCVAIQKNFEFCTDVYNYENKDEIKAQRKSNIKHFVSNYIKYLVPYVKIRPYDVEIDVIGFQFQATDCGLMSLGYDPNGDVWYFYETAYGNIRVKKQFNNFEEALDFIFEI